MDPMGDFAARRATALSVFCAAAIIAAPPAQLRSEGSGAATPPAAIASVAAPNDPPTSRGVTAPALAAERDARPFTPLPIDPPAQPGSATPALAAEGPTAVAREHEILMTWLEPTESGRRLRFARLSGQTWSLPITVAEHVSGLGPADAPSLAVIDTRSVRRTLLARTGDVIAESADGGRTWTRLPAPVLSFVSLAGGDEGAYAFWMAADRYGSSKLLGTRVLAGETLLDPRVSGGSSTSAAMTWDGPVVVYRDLSALGSRDVAMVRRQDAEWTRPRLVHTDGWRPKETPRSGPRVAAWRRQVAVAWYTEAPDRARVLVAFSKDAGRTFGAPVEVDAAKSDHEPSGPVAVALDDNGHALVLWMAATGSTETALNLARVSPEGELGEELVLANGLDARPGDIPQMVRAGDRVAVTWIEGDPKLVRAAAVPLAGIPAPGDRRPRPSATSGGASRLPKGRGRVGELVPDLELVSLDGEKASLASLRGRAVLLNLWATWCLPCIQEMPELAALHERHGKEGLAVVGVSIDGADAAAKVRRFVFERKVPFAVWLDPEMRLPRACRVPGLPATFIVDREGRIVLRRDRPIVADEPALQKALSQALSGSSP